MKTSNQLLLIIFLFVFINSCKKDNENNIPSGGSVTTSSKITTSITGRITDESGAALAGVAATVDGNTATTDANGIYILKNISVTEERCVVKLERTGFIDQYIGLHPFPGEVTYANGMMFITEGTFTFSATTGGTISLADGATAVFPANSIADSDGSIYNGSVTIKMNYINADDNNFSKKIPGRDLLATNASGESKVLKSFGMMNVELHDAAGAKLNLAAGKTAQLTFPVASSQAISAPATIPTWHFDTNSGLWIEEGSAVKNGNIYTCSVSHFSWWNCDEQFEPATIHGFVRNCDISPFANAEIVLGGQTNSWGAVTTNSSGYFKGLAAANEPPENIYAIDNNGNQTQIEIVPTLNVGQQYFVPTLYFGPTSTTLLITGTITDCDNFPVSGLAVITSPQGYWDSQLTGTNGQFAFTVTSGVTYTITVSSNGYSNQFTVNPVAVGLCDKYEIGLLPLCNTNNGTGDFTATIITTQFGNQVFNYDINHCSVTTNTASIISLTSFDNTTNYTSHFDFSVADYLPGNYAWNTTDNSLEFSMMMNGIPVTIESDLISNGGNTITTAGLPGGNTEASFSGPVIIHSPSLPNGQITGYISGNFSAFRNN